MPARLKTCRNIISRRKKRDCQENHKPYIAEGQQPLRKKFLTFFTRSYAEDTFSAHVGFRSCAKKIARASHEFQFRFRSKNRRETVLKPHWFPLARWKKKHAISKNAFSLRSTASIKKTRDSCIHFPNEFLFSNACQRPKILFSSIDFSTKRSAGKEAFRSPI